jgi:hypothetical protein
MLTVLQKATILGKAGFAVPAHPINDATAAAPPGPATPPSAAVHDWARAIETMYVSYVAARAAKSLRDAEESRQAALLRRLSLAGS